MEPTPELSVIIPVRNGARWLRRCLESVLALKFAHRAMEVLCVDNGSNDESVDILRSFQPAIRVLHESTPGPSAARNAGILLASAPLVAFTDCDCVVDPLWLSNLAAPLRSERYAAVGGRILARPEAGGVELFGELVHDHSKAIEFYQPPYLIGMNMAARKDLLVRVGMFQERWIRMEDVDLAYRILRAGEQIGYCPDAVVHHHNRDSVAKLMREGFLHGYYRPSFLREYRDFIEQYRTRPDQPAPVLRDEKPRAELHLKRWQIGLYWKVFNYGKQAGELVGRHRLPALT